MVLDSEAFYNNSLSIIATAAIAEIQLYGEKYHSTIEKNWSRGPCAKGQGILVFFFLNVYF